MSGGAGPRPGRLVRETPAAAAARVGRDWVGAPYYAEAEAFIASQWRNLVLPFLTAPAEPVDFALTLDLAAGHGRNAALLLPLVQRLWVADILPGNVAACRARFGPDARVACLLTDGLTLPCLPDRSLTLVYCFDAMVHFDSDVVRAWLGECARLLKPGGHAFLHHSNLASRPGADHRDNPGWRNFMSRELFAHYAAKEGLQVVRQKLVDWLWDGSDLDCFSLLRAPVLPAEGNEPG